MKRTTPATPNTFPASPPSPPPSPPPKRPRPFHVHIPRPAPLQAARLHLPILSHESCFIDALRHHDVVLVTGATGTGKTTQVPQFLLEEGYAHAHAHAHAQPPCGPPRSPRPTARRRIAVTQPRRVAAIACAARVAAELGHVGRAWVAYKVRHRRGGGSGEKLVFVTDGVLLREVEADILLRDYSVIVVDEVHERSLNTDLLLAFLARSVVMRRQKEAQFGPLKLVIMSATMDVEGMFGGGGGGKGEEEEEEEEEENGAATRLFGYVPVVHVESRQYKVVCHFAKRTHHDYVDATIRKVAQIHRRLPPGDVLVFLTGRAEIDHVCARLTAQFPPGPVPSTTTTTTITPSLQPCSSPPLHLRALPFHALLPDAQQRAVFAAAPPATRTVVVATNIAETSVTLPNIAYVVDCGRAKERVWDDACGLARYDVCWISQAAARQRMGRAGRVAHGHCYRLYSSAVYDRQCPPFRPPEILRVPADALVLRLRAMGIRHVSRFPFLTPPDPRALRAAERLLTSLGALHAPGTVAAADERKPTTLLGVTPIGRALARLPVSPRVGRMLLAARHTPAALPYACRMAGLLTVGTVLNHAHPDWRARQRPLRHPRSDLLTQLAAVCAAEHAGYSASSPDTTPTPTTTVSAVVVAKRARPRATRDASAVREICAALSLHSKAVLEALDVAAQLARAMGGARASGSASPSRPLPPPRREVEEGLLRAVVSAFPDQVARRMTRDEAAARGVVPRRQRVAFTVGGRAEAVFLEGASSVRLDANCEFVCYAELLEVEIKTRGPVRAQAQVDDYEGSSDDEDQGDPVAGADDLVHVAVAPRTRLVMRGATSVHARWLVAHAGHLCYFHSPPGRATCTYDASTDTVLEAVRATYGAGRWPLGVAQVSAAALQASAAGGLVGDVAGREGRRAEAFAKALVGGGLGMTVGGEVCVKAVAKVLGRARVENVRGLRKKGGAQKVGVTRVVEACCGREMARRWRESVQAALEEGWREAGPSEGGDGAEEEQEEQEERDEEADGEK